MATHGARGTAAVVCSMFQSFHLDGRYFTLDNFYIVASVIVTIAYLVYYLTML